MNLTIDSIHVVPINAQNGLFCERRVIRTDTPIRHLFLVALNIRHTVCGCMWARERAGVFSDISQMKVAPWLIALSLLQAPRTTPLPAVPGLWLLYCCIWAVLVRYSPKTEHRRNCVGYNLAGWRPGGATQR